MYNRVELVQVVYVRIVESGGLYVATSPDIPPMQAAAFDLTGLRDAIEESIYRYFHLREEKVQVSLAPRRNPDDLSIWHVARLAEAA